LFYHFPVRAVCPRKGQIAEKVGKPDIPDGKEVAAGGYAEGAGEIGFTTPVAPKMITLWNSWM
jgi:hypothetical protein